MNFCNLCENMYYMRINENADEELQFYCRKCGNTDEILNKNFLCLSEYNGENDNDSIIQSVNKYTKYDPTLPHIHNIKCPNNICVTNKNSDENNENKKNEIVYIRYNNIDMKYVYLCCNCDHIWKSDLRYE
jgi:DNA-directed RNA polymerase subunit M/transcription elongation factor TFIIS